MPDRPIASELEKLANLRDRGVLSNQEFESQKARLLDDSAFGPVAQEPTDQWSDRWPGGIEWVLVVSGALMIFGSFLPWWHAYILGSVIDRNGFQLGKDLAFSSDGVWTLIVGAIVALIGISRLTRTAFPRWLFSSPLLAGIIGLIDTYNAYTGIDSGIASQRASYPSGSYSIGYGLWLVIVGAAATTIVGALSWWENHKALRAAEQIELATTPIVEAPLVAEPDVVVEPAPVESQIAESDEAWDEWQTQGSERKGVLAHSRWKRRRIGIGLAVVMLAAGGIATGLVLSSASGSKPTQFVGRINSIKASGPNVVKAVFDVANTGSGRGAPICVLKMSGPSNHHVWVTDITGLGAVPSGEEQGYTYTLTLEDSAAPQLDNSARLLTVDMSSLACR